MKNQERVLTLYRQLLESWNKRDAEGFAAAFTEDGSCVGFDGSTMNGREEIASTYTDVTDDQVLVRCHLDDGHSRGKVLVLPLLE